MSLIQLSDFEIREPLFADDERTVSAASWKSSSARVRLTVFAHSISQQPDFRRAFKTDRGMLETVRHQCVARFGGDGESDGQLFFWTDWADGQTLQEVLAGPRPLMIEDLIEIGWQVCSALQQAHNIVLSHGSISDQTIILSPDLQVSLVDFGVQRLLRAARMIVDSASTNRAAVVMGTATPNWRDEVEQDLRSLAEVLLIPITRMIADSQAAGTPRPTSLASLERLLERTRQLNETSQPTRARDLQGRLGELLIGAEDDQIQLLDQRGPATKSGRSIVDELFDHPGADLQRQNLPQAVSADRQPDQSLFLPIVVVLLLLVIVLLIAVLLR